MKLISSLSMVCILAILITACGLATGAEQPVIKPDPVRVEFRASDGQALVGYYYPAPLPYAPVVVLMHMWRTTQQEWVRLGLVDWLQNWPVSASRNEGASVYPHMPEGVAFNVFTFDYRGHGESGPEIDFYSLNAEQAEQLQAGWVPFRSHPASFPTSPTRMQSRSWTTPANRSGALPRTRISLNPQRPAKAPPALRLRSAVWSRYERDPAKINGACEHSRRLKGA